MSHQNPAFEAVFGHPARYLFSAPGRTELSGNHTDHQHGCVLAASVDLESLAWVAENGKDVIRVQSEGYPLCEVALDDLEKKDGETNTTAALVRGVAAKFAELGAALAGFDAYVTSTVLPGSGLSSSASFEVLIGCVVNHLFNGGKCTPVEIAQIGQFAENVYFGKPSGLMDQTACAVGGVIAIDFADPKAPVVKKTDFDFAAFGHALCIIDSCASHADLTDEYAAIPQEIKKVSALFGKNVLRDIPEADFYARIGEARAAAGDRAVLRCIHFYEENRRVQQQVAAIETGDFDTFLRLTSQSGRSSWMYLQNVIPAGRKNRQEMAFALALAEKLLAGRGAVRVHGGGFAGTLLAFVPNDLLTEFKNNIEAVLGSGTCHVLSIRESGCCLVEELV